ERLATRRSRAQRAGRQASGDRRCAGGKGALDGGPRRRRVLLDWPCGERTTCSPFERMTTISPSRWTESTAALFERPLQRLRLGYAAWLFGVFCYFLPAATWAPVSRFDGRRAAVGQGTLSIAAFADSTGDRAFYDGRWYSDKAPLPALLALPAYQAYHLLDRARGKAPAYEARGTAERPAARIFVNR